MRTIKVGFITFIIAHTIHLQIFAHLWAIAKISLKGIIAQVAVDLSREPVWPTIYRGILQLQHPLGQPFTQYSIGLSR